jgi:AraC family transcriptional regulator
VQRIEKIYQQISRSEGLMQSSNNSKPPTGLKIMMAGEFNVKAGWTLGPRVLEEHELVYFPNKSKTKYLIGDKSYTLDKPGYILTRPNEEHMYTFDNTQSTKHLFIHFVLERDDLSGNWPPYLVDGPSFIPSSETSIIPTLLKQILYLASAKSTYSEKRSCYLLLAALVELEGLDCSDQEEKSHQNTPGQILKALEYIDQNLHLSLSISKLAAVTGWTHEHFTRMFVQYTGVTPRKMLMQRRIEKAAKLLIYEQESIKQIAYTVGFRDEHYFSRSFMKVKGITASRYRELYTDPRLQHLAPSEKSFTSYPINEYFIFQS